MWESITTPTDALAPASGTFKYTLQTHQANNENYLNIKTNEIIWGTYQAGYQLTNEMYLLPLTPITPFEYQVIEWYPTKMLIQTEATISSPTITIDGTPVASPTVTAKGSKWYEIGNLPLEANPAKTLTITNGGAMAIKTIPVIISRGTKTISDAPFSTLGKAVYNQTDLVVRDGAVLTVNGSATDNTFHDVTIHSNSKISVPALNTSSAENKLGVHSLTFFGGIDDIYDGSSYSTDKYGVPELSLKGKFGTKTITKIDYVMRVDDSQMYSLTVPYDVNLSEITYWDGASMGALGANLWISAYDGQARANKDMSHTWIWEVNFVSKGLEAKLKQGVGYTISAEKQFTGNPYSIIRMPMKSNVAANATETAKTVQVTAYVNTQGVTVGDNNKGWNLVGNPYMVTISGGEPFLQAKALFELVSLLKSIKDIGVIIYSGFTLEELQENEENRDLLTVTDILIDGRYIKELDDGKAYIGSSNQHLYYLSDRYKDIGQEYYSADKRRAEIKFTLDKAVLIGVPSKNVLNVWQKVKEKSGGDICDF